MQSHISCLRRRRRSSLRLWLPVGAALWAALGPAWADQGAPRQNLGSGEEQVIAVPVRQPLGITGGGGRLWVGERATREVLELAPDSGNVLRRFPLALQEPKGLAFDGTLLWVADQATRRIHAFNPDSGQAVRDIPLAVPREKGYRSVEALSWDGRYLWTAIAAGFSSSFNQIAPDNGDIVRSLFADCDPGGLAVGMQLLFSFCLNGQQNPPTIDVRTLSADDTAISKSRRLLQRIPGAGPGGLFYDGQSLWRLEPGAIKRLRVAPREGGKP